jgi:hypothetical protein
MRLLKSKGEALVLCTNCKTACRLSNGRQSGWPKARKRVDGLPKPTSLTTSTGIARAKYVTEALRYLSQELHTLLDVVVLSPERQAGVRSHRDRQQELEARLPLLEELREQALPSLQKEIQSGATQLRLAPPHLLLFAADLDEPQQQASERLGPHAVHLLAWGGPRRALLGPSTKDLVEGFDPAWREEARALLQAWERTVRVSSAVENWHSIVRPHLAVHRTLSAGMVALLAVWHNISRLHTTCMKVSLPCNGRALSSLKRTGCLP